MEIFCHNIPDHVSDNRLKKCFASILKDFGVHTYHCQRRRRGCATLTLMDAGKAQQVLNQYGDSFNGTRPSHRELQLLGRSISMRQSRNPADKILLRCLEEDELTRLRQATTAPTSELNTPKLPTSLQITSVSCGSWNYSGSDPIFVDYFQDIRNGTISFRRFSIRVSLEPREISFLTHEINFDYSTMSGSVYLGNSTPPTMTLSLDIAPRFFESSPSTLFQTPNSKSTPSKTRVSSLGAGHEAVVATCFAYRFTLMTPADLQVIHALKKKRKLPKLIWWTLPYGRPSKPLPQQMNSFLSSLNKQPLPYRVKFQLQMLVWNGLLSPSQVANLFFQARQLLVRAGPERAALVLRRLARKVPYLGPETESSEFDVAALVKAMSKTEDAVERENSRLLDTGVLHPNRVCVHKVTVTPVGTYLYGPNWESKNRVLRNHKDNTDYFIRVQFSEETGDPVRFDQSASLDQIFHKRFKSVLQDGIIIGGRRFEFLGFSHSSLRAQSCWFMAPFTAEDGTPLDARSIIPKLGDFSKIRSPAKCAARIGQAFSETLTSIPVRQDVVEVTDDIKRNGRVFSDGVGTISKSVMHMILDEYAVNAKVKPTVFQIRFAGAKGMVSLDERRKGDVLMLRKSMIKFKSSDWNIEICGSGLRPLPFYLNRPLIKILEDLGVPAQSFLDLQEEAIDRLRLTSQSPLLAAAFLEHANLARAARFPWLVRVLGGLGFHYSSDDFLRQTVELAVLVKLQEIKYRSRIEVEQGITLYGIMDETGILKEGEIYCPMETEANGREVLIRRNVTVTRSPALHPGDVQVVNAVDVPKDSPLNRLHNCIVFSQHGDRDLPSKLSGGDLDGDLYNVIYDPRLTPRLVTSPADYPRVQEVPLDRAVVKEDIVDFFIKFMQQDQLGRIATVHQSIADQQDLGTCDPDCILLSELHSNAVDFSKTGIPVDLSLIPKHRPYRPDFMAPGPRVQIAEDISLLKTTETSPTGQEDEEEEEDRPRLRYYRSEKVLGELYRAIDEQAFLEGFQSSAKSLVERHEYNDPLNRMATSVLQSLWAYVRRETAVFQTDHLLAEARNIKEIYEDNLMDLMYQYSSTPWSSPLDEREVFIGHIMGRGHSQNKRQREASMEMRDSYNRLVEFIVSQILGHGDKDTMSQISSNVSVAGSVSVNDQSLERSIACLAVAVEDEEAEIEAQRRHDEQNPDNEENTPMNGSASGSKKKWKEKDGGLVSFGWIAAAVCLGEVEKLQNAEPIVVKVG